MSFWPWSALPLAGVQQRARCITPTCTASLVWLGATRWWLLLCRRSIAHHGHHQPERSDAEEGRAAPDDHQSPYDLRLVLGPGAIIVVECSVRDARSDLLSLSWYPAGGRPKMTADMESLARAVFFDLVEAAHDVPQMYAGRFSFFFRASAEQLPTPRPDPLTRCMFFDVEEAAAHDVPTMYASGFVFHAASGAERPAAPPAAAAYGSP